MRSAFGNPGRSPALAASGLAVAIGIAAWFLWPAPSMVFTFPTDDGRSTLSYSCKFFEDDAATLDMAERAHAAFQAGLPPLAEAVARDMQDAMEVANASSDIPDFGAAEADQRERLRELLAEMRRRYGCNVSEAGF